MKTLAHVVVATAAWSATAQEWSTADRYADAAACADAILERNPGLPDEWIPQFPLEEQVQPLTASALVDLGL